MKESYQRLCAGLSALKPEAMRMALDSVIDRVNGGGISFADGMDALVSRQVEEARRRRTDCIIAQAHLPSRKTFGEFDFGFQPELNRKEVMDLETLRFMEA